MTGATLLNQAAECRWLHAWAASPVLCAQYGAAPQCLSSWPSSMLKSVPSELLRARTYRSSPKARELIIPELALHDARCLHVGLFLPPAVGQASSSAGREAASYRRRIQAAPPAPQTRLNYVLVPNPAVRSPLLVSLSSPSFPPLNNTQRMRRIAARAATQAGAGRFQLTR